MNHRIAFRRLRASTPTVPAVLLVLAVLAGVVGCGTSAGPPATDPAPTPAGSVSFPAVVPVVQACGAVPGPEGLVQRSVPLPSGTSLNTAWTGSGSTVAVLLHQTDGNGLCGFLFYADVLGRRGVRVALLDLCGYGQSPCAPAQTGSGVGDQVGAVVGLARREGAQRVVLVGASMGGSVAVTTAGAVAADGLVDLSGPAQFHGSEIDRDAVSVTMPALFAFGRETDPGDLAAVREALPAMPTHLKKVVTAASGHGYALLSETGSEKPTQLSGEVARFVLTGRLP